MIISASYKTDIPAFYAKWFNNRINEGFCVIKQPFSSKYRKILLLKNTVDAFVFWTKNAKPFIPVLRQVAKQGFPFSTSYTITGYPRVFEKHVISENESIKIVQNLSNEFGIKANVWRYDTVIFSDITNTKYHIKKFTNIARQLCGYIDEVVVSFFQPYKKTENRIKYIEQEHNIKIYDPEPEMKRDLLTQFVSIASKYKMKVTVCSQNNLVVDGSSPASCIDIHRLSDVAGKTIKARKKGKRKECGCYHSIDIGEYDTCPHGCIYCYAVRSQDRALSNFKTHDPLSPSLSKLPIDYDNEQQLEL